MEKKIKANFGTTNSCNLNLQISGNIPLCIMSEEQYNNFKIKEEIISETSSLSYKENEEVLNIISTFLHPILKTKYSLVYNKKEKCITLIPDNELFIKSSETNNLEIVGYNIGSKSIGVVYDNINTKKDPQKIEIDLDITNPIDIKISVLNLPGVSFGNNNGRFNKNLSVENTVFDNNTYPLAILKIDLNGKILNKTLPTNILTNYNLMECRLVSNEYTTKEFIENNIVFLPL